MDAKINDADVAKVAEIMSRWQYVGKTLAIGAGENSYIQREYLTPQEQQEADLKRWIMSEGSAATYRKLCNVLADLNQREMAEKIAEIAGAM